MTKRLAPVGIAVMLVVASVAVASTPAGGATGWSVIGTAAGASYGHLAAVSCVQGSSVCFAVGTQDTPTSQTKLIERWNGAKWTALASPNPSDASSSHLSAVQCISDVSCMAVGQYNTPALTTKTLALHWDGKTWSIVPSANPAGSPVSVLSGVRCAVHEGCIAVGGWFASTPDSSAESTLIEKWNGTTLSIMPSPNAVDADDSVLAGVACATNTSCFAVGSYDTQIATDTLVEHWDGTTWSVVPSPNPGSSTFNQLAGVTCATASNCVAAGGGHGSLVERWTGATWSIVKSPNPTGATGVSLTGVSCLTVLRCFAVGVTIRKASQQRLVELLAPTGGAIVNVPVPSGTKLSNLSGVSCANGNSCFAVGDFRLGPSRRPLLERYAA